MTKKRVGIITIHKIRNCGSTLQALSLQNYISLLGYDTELIDYKYPNAFHKRKIFYCILKDFYFFLRAIIFFFKYNGDWGKKNRKFWMKYYKLSPKYVSRKKIFSAPPLYDIYVVGSDQVWNTDYTYGDDVFLCSFAPSASKKISYASSVGHENIPEEYESSFRNYLTSFSNISIRDNKCKSYLEKLLDRNILTVCDPVFLTPSDFYNTILQNSKVKVPKNYILVYLLNYMFEPFPDVCEIVDLIREKYQLPIVYMFGTHTQSKMVSADFYVPIPSVEDFLFLIKNAKFIITSSFHGTAFSIIFRKQFYSVVSRNSGDYRISDLLKLVNLSERAIEYNCKLDMQNMSNIEWDNKDADILSYVNESKKYLRESLGE